MDKEKIKSSVSYRILIKSDEKYYKIGTIIIKTYKGDIFYTPSNNYMESPITLEKKEIEHVSWHINGRVHIKHKNCIEKYDIIQKNGERQKISEMGFQNMIKDTIKDFRNLTIYDNRKVVPLDVVFNTGDYIGQVCFNFSIVSGKLIIAQYKGQDIPLKMTNIEKSTNGIGVTQRALGWHSGNSDVMLQYSLKRNNENDLRTNRRIFISHDMNISKLNIDL